MTTRLVSFLGLGNKKNAPHYYEEATYQFAGKVRTSCLMPQALDGLFGPFDELVFIGTAEVKECWYESGQLARYFPNRPSLRFILAPGGDKGDPWTIFRKTLVALGLLSDDDNTNLGTPDSIALDATHGFRAQPMIGIGATMFAISEWKRQRLETNPDVRIFYGAFDAKDENGVTPVWELTDILAASRWNAALDALVRYGRADDLESLAAEDAKRSRQVAREAGLLGPDIGKAGFIGDLGKKARAFADDLALGRLHSLLTSSAGQLRNAIQSSSASELKRRLPVLEGALSSLESELKPLQTERVLSPDAAGASIALAQLYGTLQRFAEQASCLRELLVSDYGHRTNGELSPEPGEDGCDTARWHLEKRWSDAHFQIQRLKSQGHAGMEELRARLGPALMKNLELSVEMATTRNDIEHMGIRNNPGKAARLRTRLTELEKEIGDLIRLPYGSPPSTTGMLDFPQTPCFVNLSNHPIADWPESQLEAARGLDLGEPTEIIGGMQRVDPNASTTDVAALAQRIANAAIGQGARGAFVATDFTLNHALVYELQRKGVRCFSTTTQRSASDTKNRDGSIDRCSTFSFVRWREYPSVGD